MWGIEGMQSTIAATRSTGAPAPVSLPMVGRMLPATYAYLAFAAVIMATAIYTAFNLSSVVSYTRDIWHHLSVYRELMASPLEAMNPHVATDDPSRSYSPWTMFVALLARAIGADPFGAIAISAILSMLSVVTGIFLFSREYLRNAWAPALFLLVFLGSWGAYINHTGYHTVATFMYSASYPFAIVLGMGFVLWWMVLKAQKATGPSFVLLLGLLALLGAALFITHQLQGLFAVGAGIGFALFAGQASLVRRVILGVVLLGGLFVSQYWWYFDPIAFVLDPEVRKGHSAVRLFEYSTDNLSEIFANLGIALIGIAGLVNARTGRFRLELALPLLVLVSGFTYLLVNGNWVSVRILPFVALFLQIGLVAFLLKKTEAANTASALLRGGIIAALVAGLGYNIYKGNESYQNSRTFLETGYIEKHYITWSRDILAAAAYAETLAPSGATVIAHRDTAFPMEATSLAVVAIPRLFAEVPDMLERQANNIAFFDEATSTETRCSILAQYDVQMIVYRPYWLPDGVERDLRAFGSVLPKGDLMFIPAQDGVFEACPS